MPARPSAPLAGCAEIEGCRVNHGEFERENTLWGLALFGLFVLLLGLTVAIAYIYLAAD